MKYSLIVFLFFSILLGACKKAPVNKKLEGMWQLVDANCPSGHKTIDDSLYLSFQLNIIQLRKANPNNNNALGELGYYQFHDDSLYIQMKTSIEVLDLWGFRNANERFVIDKYTNYQLIILNEVGYWKFKKF